MERVKLDPICQSPLLQVANIYHLRVSPVDGIIGLNSKFGYMEILEWDSRHLGLYVQNRNLLPDPIILATLGCSIYRYGDEDALYVFPVDTIGSLLSTIS